MIGMVAVLYLSSTVIMCDFIGNLNAPEEHISELSCHIVVQYRVQCGRDGCKL